MIGLWSSGILAADLLIPIIFLMLSGFLNCYSMICYGSLILLFFYILPLGRISGCCIFAMWFEDCC